MKKTISAFALTAMLSGLLCPLLNSQSGPANLEQKITGSCWKSEVSTVRAGKCPTTLNDQALLCLNDTMAGGIEGSLTMSHTEFLQTDKVAPDDIVACSRSNGINMALYDVKVTKSPKNDLVLSETNHKCSIGDCKDMEKSLLKGILSFDGDDIVLSRTSGSKLKFVKYVAPKKPDAD